MLKAAFASIAVSGVLAAACAHAPVKKEVGQLNLTYSTKEHGAATGHTIGIVSQVGAPVDSSATATVMGDTAVTTGGRPYRWNARGDLQNYISKLAAAMGGSFTELFSQRGFKIKGPYTSFDEMTYGDKRDIFLVTHSKLQINVVQKSTGSECSPGGVCTDEGELQVSGDLNLQLLEPMTQQSVMTRRISLDDLNISKHYRKQARLGKPGGQKFGISDLISGGLGGGDDNLVDDSDRIMTEALNEFFTKAMGKIDNLLSREEILSHEKDVRELKGMKRY